MAKLNKQIQTFIVQQFAMFATPQEIVISVKENYDIEVSRQQVFFYNADMNLNLRKNWVEIFNATRQNFLNDTSSIAVANKSYRLRELDTIYKNQKAAKLQNTVAMKDTLEQAAKESGDVFTNRHKVEQSGTVQNVALTLDQWKQNAAARTAQASAAVEKFSV